MFGHLAGKNQPRSTQPVQSPREVDMAGLTAQALESHPGLRAGVCISQSLPGDEEDCSSARNASEFEHTQDLGTPGLPPVLPMPPWGSQVCLRSWAEGSWHLMFYSHSPDSE